MAARKHPSRYSELSLLSTWLRKKLQSNHPAAQQLTPWNVNRFILAAIYVSYSFATASVYFGWRNLSDMLIRSEAYAWLCPVDGEGRRVKTSEADEEFLCDQQDAMVQTLYTTAMASHFTCSAVAGILIDSVGPRATAIVGQTLNFTAWMLLAFCSEGLNAYIPVFVLMGAGADMGFLPVLTVSNLFPGNVAVVITIMGAACSASFSIPLILDVVWTGSSSSLGGNSASMAFQSLCIGYAVSGPAVAALIALLLFPRHSFKNPDLYDYVLVDDDSELEGRKGCCGAGLPTAAAICDERIGSSSGSGGGGGGLRVDGNSNSNSSSYTPMELDDDVVVVQQQQSKGGVSRRGSEGRKDGVTAALSPVAARRQDHHFVSEGTTTASKMSGQKKVVVAGAAAEGGERSGSSRSSSGSSDVLPVERGEARESRGADDNDRSGGEGGNGLSSSIDNDGSGRRRSSSSLAHRLNGSFHHHDVAGLTGSTTVLHDIHDVRGAAAKKAKQDDDEGSPFPSSSLSAWMQQPKKPSETELISPPQTVVIRHHHHHHRGAEEEARRGGEDDSIENDGEQQQQLAAAAAVADPVLGSKPPSAGDDSVGSSSTTIDRKLLITIRSLPSNLENTLGAASFWSECLSELYVEICLYFTVAGIAVAYYQQAASRMFTSGVEDALKLLIPLSFIPCIIIGQAVDRLSIMPVIFFVNGVGCVSYMASAVSSGVPQGRKKTAQNIGSFLRRCDDKSGNERNVSAYLRFGCEAKVSQIRLVKLRRRGKRTNSPVFLRSSVIIVSV